jgi:aspartate aminotransferase
LRAISGVTIAEPRGAFYAYPNISAGFRNGINSAMQFSERLLAESHVAVVPGEAFGTSQHVRLSYATSMTELARGLDRIEKFIRER